MSDLVQTSQLSRRGFLRLLGVTTAVVAVPSLLLPASAGEIVVVTRAEWQAGEWRVVHDPNIFGDWYAVRNWPDVAEQPGLGEHLRVLLQEAKY